MNIEGLIKNLPNEIFDDEYVSSNHTLFELYKEEYSLVKYLRKKMLAAKIVNSEDLESNIREELSIYDGGTLMFKQNQFGEVTNKLGIMLNTFDEENNNSFNGYTELEQYHTIASTILKMLPEILIEKMISGSKN
tara:strand:- start:371 stop:775 length:405 start_codon:yes stop_codon:yes gene_type:complete